MGQTGTMTALLIGGAALGAVALWAGTTGGRRLPSVKAPQSPMAPPPRGLPGRSIPSGIQKRPAEVGPTFVEEPKEIKRARGQGFVLPAQRIGRGNFPIPDPGTFRGPSRPFVPTERQVQTFETGVRPPGPLALAKVTTKPQLQQATPIQRQNLLAAHAEQAKEEVEKSPPSTPPSETQPPSLTVRIPSPLQLRPKTLQPF